MSVSLRDAAAAYREAMQDAIEKHRTLHLGDGILLILVGVAAFLYPLAQPGALTAPIGWLLLISALLQTVLMLVMRSMPHSWIQTLAAVVTALIALLMLGEPYLMPRTLIILLVVFLFVQGAARLIYGASIRPFPNWYWVAGSGALGIILSVILIFALPEPATAFVTTLVGVEMLCQGGAMIVLALGAHGTPIQQKGG